MECHYHQGRESTDKCAICGKPICKECGLEISGNTYCKDCLEKIVGTGLSNVKDETSSQQEATIPEPPKEEYRHAPSLERKEEANFEIDNEKEYTPKEDIYTTPEAHYTSEKEPEYIREQETYIPKQEEDFIYPDHDYQPETRSGIKNLEDKYERYLDELYDDSNISLSEQLARDEEKYGSLTTKSYEFQPDENNYDNTPTNESYYKEYTENIDDAINRFDTPKEESKPLSRTSNTSKHNIYYKNDEGNEPRTKLDILLTITFVILLIIVILYIIFLLLLSNVYPTFNDAIFGIFN